jgi:alpha/beta superfamily hydrolase
VETIYLETIDGINVEADLVRTDAEHVRAVVIIGHPHPLYGGDRFNHVVRAIQEVALGLDCHSIAVDFRGVNNSGGFHDDGDSERLDLAAACQLSDLIAPEVDWLLIWFSCRTECQQSLDCRMGRCCSTRTNDEVTSLSGKQPASKNHHRC